MIPDNLIELRTVDIKGLISQRLVLLNFFFVGVTFQNLEGSHFGIDFGIGPFELNFKVRFWNAT